MHALTRGLSAIAEFLVQPLLASAEALRDDDVILSVCSFVFLLVSRL